MRVVNDQGQVLDLPEQEAWQGVMSGALGFEPGASVPLTNAAGVVGTVKAEDLHSALQQGYVPATQADFDRAAKEARYDTAGHMVGAGAAGVARGLTFGASDPLLTAIGGESTRETLEAYQEQHPGLSLTGEIAGAVLPALVSGGTTAEVSGAGMAARGAKALGTLGRAATAPGRGVAALGRLAEEATAGIVGHEAKGLLARGVQTVLPKAIGAGVEGAFQGAGQALSESAIKNHNLTAEKLWAGVKDGALLGAAFGGATAGLGFAAGEARSAIASRIAKLPEGKALDSVVDLYAHSSGFLTGKDPQAIKRLLKDPDFLAKAVKDPGEVTATWARDLAKAGDKVDDTSRMLRDVVWGEGKRLQTKGMVPKGNLPAIREEAGNVLGQLRAQVNEMAHDPAMYNSPWRLKKAREVLDRAERNISDAHFNFGEDFAGSAIFSELDWVKRKLGRMAQPNAFLGVDDAVAARMRSMYDDVLKPALEREDLFGKAAVAQREINEVAKHQIGTAHEFEKRFSASTGMKDPVDEWMTLSRRDPGKLQSTLSQLGDPSADLAQEVMRSHADNTVKTLEAYKKHYVLDSSQLKSVNEAIDAAKTFQSTLAKAEEHVGAIKVLQGLEGARSPLGAMAGSLPVMGAVLGGGAGAAAGVAGKVALDALTDPAGVVRKLAFIRSVTQRVDSKIDTSISRIISSAGEAVGKGVSTGRRAATYAALKPDYSEQRKARRADYERKRDIVLAAIADPSRTQAHVGNLDNAAPSLANAARAAATRQAQYLASILPERASRSALQPGLDKKSRASDGEIDKFLRRYDAATDPTKTLDRLASGKASRDEMMALRDANPQLFADVQKRAMTRVAEATAAGRPLPYEARVKLGRLLDIPADPSMTPEFAAAAQAVFAQAKAENIAKNANAAKVKLKLDRYRYGDSDERET